MSEGSYTCCEASEPWAKGRGGGRIWNAVWGGIPRSIGSSGRQTWLFIRQFSMSLYFIPPQKRK